MTLNYYGLVAHIEKKNKYKKIKALYNNSFSEKLSGSA